MTAEIETLKSEDILDLPSSATADECMESLIERYDLEAYTSPEDIRRIASVRYGMERAYFSRTNPFVLAKDISIETVELLSERSADLPGLETQVEQTREYPEGDLAPHIVGTLGAISQEQYDAAEEAGNTYSASNVSGYSYTDTVAKAAESVFESTLRGKNGKESVTTDGHRQSDLHHRDGAAGSGRFRVAYHRQQCAARGRKRARRSRLKRSRPKTARPVRLSPWT